MHVMSVFMCVFVSILFSYNAHGVRNDHLKYASANLETSKINNVWLTVYHVPKLTSIKRLNKNQKVFFKITKTIIESLVSVVG